MVEVITTNWITGFSSGTVIYRKLWKVDAPSRLAASYRELGIFCSPASRIMAL